MNRSTLVLARRLGETIIIGGDSPQAIEITPGRMRDGQVHLKVCAPRDMPVDRLEIHERKVSNAS
jgi:sRNA-binding carbon storage regulator CsrA